MNIGAILVLAKLFQDAFGPVSLVGPPGPDAPNGDEIPSSCYMTNGKLSWLCYLKYVDPAASPSDYEDYLKGA